MVMIDWYFWWRGVSNIQSVVTQLGSSYRQTVRGYIHWDVIEHSSFRGIYPLWLPIRLLGVIYQIFELFLILWTFLCKEWNCDFWLPKDIHGHINHAIVIWRKIIDNVGFSFLLNCNSFLKKSLVLWGKFLGEEDDWDREILTLCACKQKFLYEPYLPPAKLPFWPF